MPRPPRLARRCLLLLPAALACTPGAQPAKNRKAVPMKLKDETWAELLALPADHRAVVAVRCEKADLIRQGSRSGRAVIEAAILAGEVPGHGKTVTLSCYAQGNPPMKPGQAYVVATYLAEWAPAWSLAEALPLDPREAEVRVRDLTAELARRAR